MAISPRAHPVLALALVTLGGCDGFGAREAGNVEQMQALPGETWLYSYSNDTVAVQSTLLMIDPLTGGATAIGAPIAGFVDALAFDATNQVLYGAWRQDAASSSELVTVDWHTGAVTAVGPLVTTDVNTPSDAVVLGMSFAPDGTLMGLTNDPERLVTIQADGTFSLVADTDFTLDDYGATFIGADLFAVNSDGVDLLVYQVDLLTASGTQQSQVASGAVSVGATTDDLGLPYVVLGSELHTLDVSFTPQLVGDTGWSDLGSLAWILEPQQGGGPTLDDACPCDGGWSHHGEYVTCVVDWAHQYATSGREHGLLVSTAARSDCGR